MLKARLLNGLNKDSKIYLCPYCNNKIYWLFSYDYLKIKLKCLCCHKYSLL